MLNQEQGDALLDVFQQCRVVTTCHSEAPELEEQATGRLAMLFKLAEEVGTPMESLIKVITDGLPDEVLSVVMP